MLIFEGDHRDTLSSANVNVPRLDVLETPRKMSSPLSQEDLLKKFAAIDLEDESLSTNLMAEAWKIALEDTPRTTATFEDENTKAFMPRDEETDSMLLPTYIKLAWRWLLGHLHNPYPSNNLKMSLAKESDTSLKTIDIWFANVRRRIGWTAISKRRFNGCRSNTVHFAHRVFKGKESDLPLDNNIVAEFLSMKEKAEGLYQGKMELKAEENSSIPLNNSQNSEVVIAQPSLKRKRSETSVAILSHPSTYFSSNHYRYHVPDDVLGSSSSEDPDSSDTEASGPRRIRIRTPSSSSSEYSSSRSSTPLPTTPKDEQLARFSFDPCMSLVYDNLVNDDLFVPPVETLTHLRFRKRRLSQPDEASSKRPRGGPFPRLHAVSDSYLLDQDDTLASSILSQLDFTLPEPVSLNDTLPPVFETSLFQDWAKLSDSIAPVANLQSFASSSLPCQNNDSIQSISDAAASLSELSGFIDLHKLFEEVTNNPPLSSPLLPDTESLPFTLTTDDGKSDSSFPSLDVPLCTSAGTDFRAAQQSQFDLISMLVLSDPQTLDSQAGTETAETDDLPETYSNASVSTLNTPVADGDAFQVLQKQVDPEETTTVTKADDGKPGSSDQSREGKLQKLQLLLAEAEKLKQELSC